MATPIPHTAAQSVERIERAAPLPMPAPTPGAPWRWPLAWLAALLVLGGLGAYHWLIYTPHPDRPHLFTALDRLFALGVALLVVGNGLLLGLRLLRALRLTPRFTRLELGSLGTGLGLGLLSLLTLGLGVVHLYYAATFCVLLVGLPWLFPVERAWLVETLWEAGRRLRASAPTFFQLHRSFTTGPGLFDRSVRIVLAALVCGYVALTYLRDLTLPLGSFGYDTYQYHWAIPALLLRAHAMQGFPGWAHANLPFNTEMLNLIALSVQAPIAATYIQDTFGLLFGLLAFAVVRRAFGVTLAWLAVSALTSIPLFMIYTSQSFVEAALLFYSFASLALLVRWLDEGAGVSRNACMMLAVAGACFGFAIGVKYTAVEYIPALLLLLVGGAAYWLWRTGQTPGAPLTYTGVNQDAPVGILSRLRAISGALVCYGVGAALVFAPWLIKDWVYLGDPVYPALASIFPTPLWNPARDQTLTLTFYQFGPAIGTVARFHLWAIDLFIHPKRYGEGTGFTFGPLVYSAALLPLTLGALLWRAWRTRASVYVRQALVAGCLALFCVCGLVAWSESGAKVERYALPIAVLTLLLGGLLCGWLITEALRLSHAHGSIWWRTATTLLALALLGIYCFSSLSEIKTYSFHDVHTSRSVLPLLTAQTSEMQDARTHHGNGWQSDYWRMISYVNQQLPHDGRLLMVGRGSGYYITNRDYVADSGDDWIPYLVSVGQTPNGILHLLQRQGFTYVVYDAFFIRFLVNTYHNTVIAADLPMYLDFQQNYLTPLAAWGDISVYRVPNAQTNAPTAAQASPTTVAQAALAATPINWPALYRRALLSRDARRP